MPAGDPIANTLKSWDSFQGYSLVVSRNIRLLSQEIGNLEPLYNLQPRCIFRTLSWQCLSHGRFQGRVIAVVSMSGRRRNQTPLGRNESGPIRV
jgi:hypothetical protein